MNSRTVIRSSQNPCTDYSQPPMSGAYPGVLNTGSRLYNHPALSGALPEPWLPVLAEPKHEAEVPQAVKDAMTGSNAVIVDLRRRWSIAKRAVKKGANAVVPGVNISIPRSGSERSMDEDHPAKAWRGSQDSSSFAHSRDQTQLHDEPIPNSSLDEDEEENSDDLEDDEGAGLSR